MTEDGGKPMTTQDLHELEATLIEGLKRSKQGSYQRRKPDKAAIPFLMKARKSLREYVQRDPGDAKAWRLLSQAEEALLNYPAAKKALERVLKQGASDRRDLKRMALLKEYSARWDDLGLTPDELDVLGRYLEQNLDQEPCDHTLRRTEDWLQSQGKKKIPKILEAIKKNGGYCDCEVFSNVVEG